MPKGKKHVEARTKAERVVQRKKMGTLKSLTVQPKTKKRYEAAVQRFFSFLRENSLQLPKQRYKMDDLLGDYIEHLWATGEGRALASDTVAGLQDADPHLKGVLPSTWRLLKVWNQHEIPNRAPPIPEKALHAMVGHALLNDDPMFALSLLVGFYSMLRTGEILSLNRHHVDVSSPKGPAILSLGLTKGGRRQGAAESCTVTVFDAVRRLYQFKQSRNSSLVPSAHQWRDKFASTCKAVGLETFGFRPYSLRRGGATFWFARHGSLDRLLLQGRWQAVKTARVYLNEGLALLAEMQLPTSQLRGFIHLYQQALDKPLPSLEPPPERRSSGGRGKGRKTNLRTNRCEFVYIFLKQRMELSFSTGTRVSLFSGLAEREKWCRFIPI